MTGREPLEMRPHGTRRTSHAAAARRGSEAPAAPGCSTASRPGSEEPARAPRHGDHPPGAGREEDGACALLRRETPPGRTARGVKFEEKWEPKRNAAPHSSLAPFG